MKYFIKLIIAIIALSLFIIPTKMLANVDDSKIYVKDGKTYKKIDKNSELVGEKPDRGWWFGYDELEKKEKKEKDISEDPEQPLMNEKEKENIIKEKNLGNLLKAMLIEMKKQTKLQKKILNKLEYAYPKTVPTYTINKKTGKRCKSNSSIDCFVMPVIAEGQQVPVLKNMLRNPNKKTAEEYLKWQAKYFNHITDIAYSMKYAYNDKGKEAYPTDTINSRTNTLFNFEKDARSINENYIIRKYKDNIGVSIFIDNNMLINKSGFIYEFLKMGNAFTKELRYLFVFKNKKLEDEFLQKLYVYKNDKSMKKYYDNLKYQTIVKPDLFKIKNIQLSPTTFLIYKDKKDKSKNFEQIIETGTISVTNLRKNIIDALIYYKIVKPKDLSVQDNYASVEKLKKVLSKEKEKNNEK